MASIITLLKAISGGPVTLAYTILRTIGVSSTLVLVIRAVQVLLLVAIFAAIAFKSATMLGYDPLQILWGFAVDLLEAALREVLGDKFSL